MFSKVGVVAVAMTLMTPAPGLSPAAIAGPSDRAPTVRITFAVDLQGTTAPSRQCSLELARGSDGIDVLQAAVDQGCVNSYQISGSRYPPPGPWDGWSPSRKGRHWLRCIDAICDAHAAPGWAPGTQWTVDWNGRDARHWYWNGGLEGYAAARGDVFAADLKGFW